MVDIVARAKSLILTPKTEWPAIAAEPTDIKSLFTGYVMILAAIPAIAGLIGLTLFVSFGGAIFFAFGAALTYGLGIASVFIIGKIVPILAPKFGGSADEMAGMKLAAYAPTAAWAAGIFSIIPMLGMIGSLLGLYSIYLYYLGAMAVAKVPQDKAIVFTIVLFLIAFVLFMIIGAIVSSVTLRGMAGVMGAGMRMR